MAEYCANNRSTIRMIRRLDAEYFRKTFQQSFDLVVKHRWKRLSQIAFVTDGEHGTVKTIPCGFARYYGARNVLSGILTDNAVEFITETEHRRLAKSILKKDDVLISCVGANIGSAAVVPDNIGNANIVRNVALIRSVSNDISNHFLLCFFLCRYGTDLFVRMATGNAQPLVSLDNIKKIPVPIFSNINSLLNQYVNRAKGAWENSGSLYDEAEQLLLSELGLQDWKPTHTSAFVRNYSQATRARRIDAEHFQPKYAELRAHIRSYPHGYLKITDIAINSDETTEPRVHPEQQFEYIELAGSNQVIGTIESANQIKGKDAPSRARMLLRTGDVIASTVEGSLDKVALVSEEYHGAIGSTGFFVLRPRTVASGYLLALTKSIIVREQMRCESSGTILAAVPAKSLRNITVPNIPPDKRDKIAELVQQAQAARREAKAILEKAKRAVEIAIEENEELAIEFIR